MSRRKKRTTAAAMAVATAAILTTTGAPTVASAQTRTPPSKPSVASTHSERNHVERKQAQQDYLEAVTEARRVLTSARAEVNQYSQQVKKLKASLVEARQAWESAVAAGDSDLAFEWSRDVAVRTERYEAARTELKDARRTYKHDAQKAYRAAVKAAQAERDAAFRALR